MSSADKGSSAGTGDAYYAADEKTGQPVQPNDTPSGAMMIENQDGAAGDNSDNDNVYQPRQGHLCCGHFCDMRRAVIIANTVNITLALFEIIIPRKYLWTLDGDYVDGQQNVPMTIGRAILLNLPRIILSTVGILGAFKFTYWQIFLVALWHATDAAVSMILFDIPGIITGILYTYPHVVFAQQLYKGIMTPETYPREQNSCFGVV